MQNNLVCCIIVTYNIGKKFDSCFNSIVKQVNKVIIVDNGSNKETIDVLFKLKNISNTEIIYNDNNMGIAYALNKGIQKAINDGYEWVITLDNDSEATEFMVETMLCAYNSLSSDIKPKVVSLFPKYLEKNYVNYNFNIISNRSNLDVEEIDTEITSGNLIKTDIFKEVGFFDEKLFIDYVDHEFCLRIRANGYKLLKVNGAILLHQLGKTVKKNILGKEIIYTNHSYIRRYYITRNRLYVWKKYYKYFPNFIKFDIKSFWKEMLKILIYEENKLLKIKMIVKGIMDFLYKRFGEYN